MEIGTAETLKEADEVRRARTLMSGSGVSGGPNGGGGGGDGPDGDGPDRSEFPVQDHAEHQDVDKSKYIAWFLLMAVGMTFAGLLGAYLMLATNRAAEWKPFELPYQIWLSTAFIIASSLTYVVAKRGIDNNDHVTARKWLLATTCLGGLFVSSQLILWIAMVNQGFYMAGNPYAGFFYILTAAHLVHVAGGIIALASIVLKCWYPTRSEQESKRRRELSSSVGWYWHFMGVLWVVLFLMLGF